MLGRVDPLVADDPAQLGHEPRDIAGRSARGLVLRDRGTFGSCAYGTIHDNTAVDCK